MFLYSEFPNPLLHLFRRRPCPSWCVAILSVRARGPGGWGGGGKSSLHSLLFSPTPPGELARMLFTTVLALVFITVIVSTHLCVICNYFCRLKSVSPFQDHVACQNFTLTAPPLAVVWTMKSIYLPEGQLTKSSNAHYFTLQESESPVGIL